MTRNNELYDGVDNLSGKYFTLSHVRDNPLIHTDPAVREGKAHLKRSLLNNTPVALEHLEKIVDFLIRSLWHIGKDSIHDMRVVNTDAVSHCNKYP